MTISKFQNKTLFILMGIIVFDVMGMGLVIPIFPQLFFIEDCVFSGYSINLLYLFYGLGVSLWPLGTFLGTPYLGLLSDKHGRKKLLIVCLFALGLSYALTGIAIITHNIVLFLFIRFFGGFFGGAYDIAQASIADISSPDNKARNIGMISFAVSVGVIFGPVISGITTSSNLLFLFTLTTPFWLATAFAFINTVFIAISFKETFIPQKNINAELKKVFSLFMFAFKDSRIAMVGTAFLFYQIAFGIYITVMPILLEKNFNATIQSTGFFFCIIGIGIAFSILFIQKKVLNRINLISASIYFLIILLVISIMLVFLQKNIFYDFISGFILGMCQLIIYSSMVTICSNSVSMYEQGKVMGGLGAITSFSLFLSGILSSLTADYSFYLPIILMIFSLIICLILMVFVSKKRSSINI